jgi:hypothetical protein
MSQIHILRFEWALILVNLLSSKTLLIPIPIENSTISKPNSGYKAMITNP